MDEKQKSILITEEGYEAAEEVLEVGHQMPATDLSARPVEPCVACMIVSRPVPCWMQCISSGRQAEERLTAQLQSLVTASTSA